ncbi:MAG TPA: TIGR02996 domain-containing protein [Kofleriaceae bacterium]|jgi:uncharacterized protein (TIGR02996 family)
MAAKAIIRTLVRDGASQTYRLAGATLDVDGTSTTFPYPHAAAERLVELCRTRIGQGWRGNAKTAVAFVRALDKLDIAMSSWVRALDDDELAVAYRDAMKRNVEISVNVLRDRPSRELFRWMLERFDDYYEDDLTKAVKFLGKDRARAAWMADELRTAKIKSERGKRFAQRNAAKLDAGPKPAPVAPKRAVGDEASLLAAIAADPDDDAPRLVYADWMLDRGDGFGEFIQADCKLAALADDAPESAAVAALSGKLLRKHEKAWLAPIRPFIRKWQWHRGLISELTCDAKLFIEAAVAIAARAPRARLDLTGLKPKDVPALAACPLGAFAMIVLDSQRIDAAQMATIAKSPTIAGVECWWLGYNPFGDDGLRAIASSPHFAATRELRFNRFSGAPSFSAGAFGALLASPKLTALRELELAVTSVTGAFERCKVALDRLELTTATFDDADAAALAAARPLAKLRRLSIKVAHSGATATAGGIAKLRTAFRQLEVDTTDAWLSLSVTR